MENKSEAGNLLIIEGTESKQERTCDFKTSYFHDEYQQAFIALERIINHTLDRQERNRISSEINNIVPFIGKRGSGKTSAMMSFVNALDRYPEEKRRKEEFYTFRRQRNGKEEEELNVQFTCIDCIDGSLLEKGEDIFKIILAQMFRQFTELDQSGHPKEKNFEYEKRELQQQFDKIYRSACQLELESRIETYYEESSITSLKNLSSSLTVKAEFEKMVQQYLKLFRNGQQKYGVRMEMTKAEHFLIVLIDDLDLNINNGYEMLEKIHRYMMVDNIIVLLSVDYDQVKLLCEKKFYSIVPNYDTKLNEKSEDVERLAQDFLDKVLPTNMRVYMPMLNKTTNVMVKMEGESERKLKEATFKKIYEKLGMRMDIAGTKRHFYEQNSLRTFISFYLMLNDMNELNKEVEEESEKAFERNYKVLMFDTITRMADDRLNSESKKKFVRITESGLPHSSRNLYVEILNNKDDVLCELREDLTACGYSYGEILRIIYCWGRVNSERKELVRCLLAFYSLEFIKSFYYYNLNEYSEKGKKARKQLLDTINGSFAGSWADRMFPTVNSHKEHYGQRMFKMGIIKDLDIEKVFSFDLEDLLKGRQSILVEDNFDFSTEIPVISKVFRSVLILGMFFEQPHYKVENSFHWHLENTKKESPERGSGRNRERLTGIGDDLYSRKTGNFANKEGKATFNIFNFVPNALQYEENIKPVIESLYDVVFSGSCKDRKKEEILKEIGIEEEFRKWKDYSGGFALPLYDIDIMYNVMKRLRQREQLKNRIESEEVLDKLKETYEYIQKKLKENDEWYEKLEIPLKHFPYYNHRKYGIYFEDAFKHCPYMEWLFNKDLLIDNFSSVFQQMIDNLPWSGGKLLKMENEITFFGYED